MPVSYQFSCDHEVTLNEVDNYVCELVGEEPNPKQYHYLFNLLVVDGFIAALLKLGGSEITCAHMLWIMDIISDEPNGIELLCAVIEKYDFKAWR